MTMWWMKPKILKGLNTNILPTTMKQISRAAAVIQSLSSCCVLVATLSSEAPADLSDGLSVSYSSQFKTSENPL